MDGWLGCGGCGGGDRGFEFSICLFFLPFFHPPGSTALHRPRAQLLNTDK